MNNPPEGMKEAVALPMLKSRTVCLFCAKKLLNAEQTHFHDLCLLGSNGAMVLTCREHEDLGKMLVSRIAGEGPQMLKELRRKLTNKMMPNKMKGIVDRNGKLPESGVGGG